MDRPLPRNRTATTTTTTPPETVRRHGTLLVLAMVVTFIALRAWLRVSPDADFTVSGFNVHHLFTGLLLVALGGVPLALFRGTSRRMDLAVVTFGAGLGMALDEWVYLIATDGSNASYLLPISFWGGIAVVGLACIYTATLVALRGRR